MIICNGQLREATNDNPSGVFDNGTVTVLAMYPKQPFDFAGRTGTVSFDVSNDSHGTHSAWPEFWMTDLPIPAPFGHFFNSLPPNGFGVRFGGMAPAGGQGGCPDQPTWTSRGGRSTRPSWFGTTSGKTRTFRVSIPAPFPIRRSRSTSSIA